MTKELAQEYSRVQEVWFTTTIHAISETGRSTTDVMSLGGNSELQTYQSLGDRGDSSSEVKGHSCQARACHRDMDHVLQITLTPSE